MRRAYLIWIVLMSCITFVMYGIDKRKAIKSRWRIKESTLILLAYIGGSFGAECGMHVFHHKTKHMKFRILVPISCIVWICIGIFVFVKYV